MSVRVGEGMIYDARTDRGLCRNVNQDAIAAFVKGNTGLFVLADGMGGHSMGELASRAVVGLFQRFWQTFEGREWMPDFQTLSNQVQHVILNANQEIHEKYNQGQVCGTTVAVLLIADGYYAFFSVGDSRIYSYDKRGIRRLTVDDVWDNLPSVSDVYTKEEMAVHKNSGKLTQAVGVKSQICIHSGTDRIGKGQIFLVCSDGLYKFCGEDEIRKYLRHIQSEKTLHRAADRLMQGVFDHGAEDNVSLILIRAKADVIKLFPL